MLVVSVYLVAQAVAENKTRQVERLARLVKAMQGAQGVVVPDGVAVAGAVLVRLAQMAQRLRVVMVALGHQILFRGLL